MLLKIMSYTEEFYKLVLDSLDFRSPRNADRLHTFCNSYFDLWLSSRLTKINVYVVDVFSCCLTLLGNCL